MKAAFGGLLLAAVLAAKPAMADAVAEPDPAPARSSTAMAGGRFHPVQVWGGLGYYNTGANGVNVGQFGFNFGGSYAIPYTSDVSWLGWGNIALAFGDANSFPISVGAGIRGEHVGPIQLTGLAGLTIAPISEGAGTKVGLAIGAQANYPAPQILPGLGIQAAFMYHILTDDFHIWTINGGITYILPY